MKRIVFLFLNLLWATFVVAQVVNIPDANFKKALVSDTLINTNKDTEIQVSEAVDYTYGINVSEIGIKDLTGIEAFVNFTKLNCGKNSLNSLDLSKNVALTYLDCFQNTINVLNIKNNIKLTSLICSSNKLSSLDVSNNILLEILSCNNNKISNLDVNNNLNLIDLNCSNNFIKALDLSKHTVLTYFDCSNNVLNLLNVKNGANNLLKFFDAYANPLLKCIEVDNPNAIPSNWSKDSTASYSSNCMIPTKDISSEGFLQLYPNPSTDSFAFSNLTEVPLSVAIYDLHGKLVQHYPSPASNYDISTLCNGLYIVKAQFATGEAIAKLVKGE